MDSNDVYLYVNMSTPKHAAWIEDERSPHNSTPIYRDHPTTVPNRPLWQDVLWGREQGHGCLFGAEILENDTRYIDYEFDSGSVSPVEE